MNDRARTRFTGLAGITNLSLLAPLRTGMIPGIEPMSYVGRLRKVLESLHTSRQNLRESELKSVFPDVVARFGVIHNFRYALVRPDEGAVDMPRDFGIWKLSLNVTFDGGWEPYMRVIKDDIGPLLDLLFCHAPDYPGSTATYDQYCDWVREHEVPAGLFYADSARTVHDSNYLAEVEAMQREGKADADLTRHRRPTLEEMHDVAITKAWEDPDRALALPLRTLKGLYRLATYFPPVAHEDVLRRFAQYALKSPILFMREIRHKVGAAPASDPLKRRWEEINVLLRNELDWLQPEEIPVDARPTPVLVDRAALQAHVLGDGERMTHGCLVLLQVKDPGRALGTITAWEPRCRTVLAGEIGYLVSFTYRGLEALGVTPDRLAALPQEFFEGMEARYGLLGDLRSNHPDRWTRPLLWNQKEGQRADLSAVHLVLQLRLDDPASQDEKHARLYGEVGTLEEQRTGMRVLAVEPMRSYRNNPNDVHAVGHMGVADGVSQPKLPSETGNPFKHHEDQVSAGELLLGYANDRRDKAPADDPLLHNGTFLAVRKLRQFMEQLDQAVQRVPLEKMVGRAKSGAPLSGLPADCKHDNDFRFTDPMASDACPFHSHIRRANPRDGRAYMPRILRRGMSWGPRSDSDRSTARGSMFMAYCASLSEQFETIQRWIAGGNASGVGSGQGDPLLRVPKEDEDYTFRYLDNDGRVQRAKLPAKPLVQLQWGIYAFVPSLKALRTFVQFTQPAAATRAPQPEPDLSDLEATRALLEDRDKNETAWQWVRDRSPLAPQDRAYGNLRGKLDEVLEVLRDDGSKYSVRGYGQRMEASIGLNLLGMDPRDPRRIKELRVKAEIAAFSESRAFGDAQKEAQAVLDFIKQKLVIPNANGDNVVSFPMSIPSAEDDNVVRFPIDLVDFSREVIAKLCTKWFGLPDGVHMIAGNYRAGMDPTVALCPGSLGPASRYMFMPHPQENLAHDGVAHAKAVRQAVQDWLAERPTTQAGTPDLTGFPLSLAIQVALAGTQSDEHLSDNIAGTMLGFTPSVQSNFLRVMETWIDNDRALWLHQQSLFERSTGAKPTFAEAADALREPLMKTMRKHPVPTMVWRCPVVNGEPVMDPAKKVVLGLQSAMTDPAAQDVLVFGRYHDAEGNDTTVHGCPGYELAVGVMLAMIGTLMKAGTLRPTGSPVLLILTQPK